MLLGAGISYKNTSGLDEERTKFFYDLCVKNTYYVANNIGTCSLNN